MNHCVYIALGSNLGHRLNFLRQACKILREEVLEKTTLSVVLQTEALLLPNSPEQWNKPHLNMVVRGYTSLEPSALLRVLKSIEVRLGRDLQAPRWSPRTIDLDILLYDHSCIQTEDLKIPHPQLKQRDFLLHLVATLDGGFKDPETGETFDQLARKRIPKNYACFSQSFALYPQLMGVVNVTPDSFSDGGLFFKPEDAIKQCEQLLEDGASLIDIGAQSTRPGSVQLDAQEEWERLSPILTALNLEKIPVSIDTYRDEIVTKLLERYKIAWINDVSGNLSPSTLRLIAQAGCKLCTMHSLSIPPKKEENISNPWRDLNAWAEKQIDKLVHCGFPLDNIVLDPGLGFGKTPYQSGYILNTIDTLNAWHCPILIGHSRKSFYNVITHVEAHQRDLETLAVSQYLKDKVDYLRVHNVNMHQRFLATQQWIESSHEYTTD